MDALQRFLAWYLGLRSPRPGEGIAWRFDWRWPAPQWLILVFILLAVIFVAGIYRRDGALLGRGRRAALTGLRLAVFALILGLLTELSLSIERTGLPVVAVMIDTSASMSLQDHYSAASKSSGLISDFTKSGNTEASRLALSQYLLTRNHGQLLRDLEHGHQLHFIVLRKPRFRWIRMMQKM